MKSTILVIEQNEITAKILRMALLNDEYQILEARDANQAFKLMSQHKPDLILQDAAMSGDSVELTQKLHNLPDCDKIPVILISGFLNRRAKEVFIKSANYVAFLIKPIDPSHLLETITEALLSPSIYSEEQAHGEMVLVVDDDESLLELLCFNLECLGFKTLRACNAEVALTKLAKITPHAIVSDIVMPKIDGFDFCLKIRTDPKNSDIPIILISSHYMEEADSLLAKKVGATSLIGRTQDLDKNIASVILKKMKKPVGIVTESLENLQKEHHYRVVCQLEKQVAINAELVNRCALQTTKLYCVQKVTNMLLQEKQEKAVLRDILATGLDTAGISVGLLYLCDTDYKLTLSDTIGVEENEIHHAGAFFGAETLFKEVLKSAKSIEVHEDKNNDSFRNALLEATKVEYGLLLPLISQSGPCGVLFLGSHAPEIIEAESQNFVSLLCMQLIEGLQFTTIISRLRASEHRYHTLMNQAGCGIVILNEEFIIQESNAYAEKIFGLTQAEMIHKPFSNLLFGEYKSNFSEKTQVLSGKEIIRIEDMHIEKKNKSIAIVEMSMAKIHVEGSSIILILLHDVTEINQLRRQSLLNDRLATTGSLAVGVAHEINNPASYIFTNLYFIQSAVQKLQEMSDEMGVDQQNLLEEIYGAAQQSMDGIINIGEIINSLKGFTRIDEHVLKISNLHEIIDAAISLLTHKIRYHAKLEKHYTAELPAFMGVPGKLQQLFVNLILNALQAIPEGHPEKNKIIIRTYIENNSIGIEISDTGAGIPKHILPFIFDPFFTTKTTQEGTGLGLSICYDIVVSHHGKLSAQSTEQEGTKMTVLLPIKKDAKIKEVLKPMSSAPLSNNLNLLFVDDDPRLLKAMQRLLSEHHEVTIAEGGQAALDVLAKNSQKFDVIITDLFMPGISGMDLYHMVQRQYKGLEKRLLFITGGNFSEGAKRFLSEIDNEQMGKPFRMEELLAKIETVVAKNSTYELHPAK